jgi:hypothetical protein
VRAGVPRGRSVRGGDLDDAGARERAVPLDDGDLPGGDQPLQALVQAGDHRVLVGEHRRHVDAVQRRADAELSAVRGGVGHLGRMQERLGGYAANVQAGAADLALFDKGDAQAQLCSPERGGIAAAAPAEHDDVERGRIVMRRHVLAPR